MNKLPAQEVILVWVFVKHFHFQLLTRYFMDNHLTHTHTHKWTNTQYTQQTYKYDTITQGHANRITTARTFHYCKVESFNICLVFRSSFVNHDSRQMCLWARGFRKSRLSRKQGLPVSKQIKSPKNCLSLCQCTYLVPKTCLCSPYKARTPGPSYNCSTQIGGKCSTWRSSHKSSISLSPHTSHATVGSGCCPHDGRWRSGFLLAERRKGPTSRRLIPWWLCPWQSGPQPPAGGYAQLPSMCIYVHGGKHTHAQT